jgi:hypothetical protein
MLMLAALLWPAIYNGEPFYFSDTTAYVRGADAAFQKFTGASTPWSQESATAADIGDKGSADSAPPLRGFTSVKDKTVLSGRSVYYGALLYIGDRLGGFWVTVLSQALLIILSMAVFLRTIKIPLGAQFMLTVVLLAAVTSVAFYASFLMPDLFAAVTILGCATLLASNDVRPTHEYVLWFFLVSASLAFHSSHVVLAGGMLLVGLIQEILGRSWPNWRGLVTIVACLVAALAAEALFGWGVKRAVGAPPMRPPFLMARLIDDGPGYTYLKESCPQSGFEVCNYLDRLPLKADQFIWARYYFDSSKPGVFADASPEVRRRLSDEQTRFALAVLVHEPGAVLLASSENVLLQLATQQLSEFDQANVDGRRFEKKLPPQYRAQYRSSAAYRGTVPADAYSIINPFAFWLSALTLLVIVLTPRVRRLFAPLQLRAIGLLGAGVIVNAAVCGIMSGPHGRYEARVSWLIPFAAIVVLLQLLRLRRSRLKK